MHALCRKCLNTDKPFPTITMESKCASNISTYFEQSNNNIPLNIIFVLEFFKLTKSFTDLVIKYCFCYTDLYITEGMASTIIN